MAVVHRFCRDLWDLKSFLHHHSTLGFGHSGVYQYAHAAVTNALAVPIAPQNKPPEGKLKTSQLQLLPRMLKAGLCKANVRCGELLH